LTDHQSQSPQRTANHARSRPNRDFFCGSEGTLQPEMSRKILDRKMIKRIDHVNIVVSDLKKAEDFFVLLGFDAGPRAELAGKWISEVVGLEEVEAEYIALSHPGSTVKIELIRYISPRPEHTLERNRPHTIGLRHLAFEVDNIELVVTKLQAAGIEFMSEVKTYPATGKKIIYFTGPDDIILELAEYSKQ